MILAVRRGLRPLLAATFLAAALSAADRLPRIGIGAIPFRHTIVDGSADLTRPAKAVGDMNGDGFIDIVCGGSTGLFWYEYPTWTKRVIDPTRVENDFGFSVDMQVGDINGDGRLDVIVGDYKRTHTVQWYENPGPMGGASGRWQAHLIHTFKAQYNHDVEVGDFDRDGRLDVLLRAPNGLTELLFQNTPDSWTPVAICQEPGEGSALADLDGDGDLDVVQANYWLECPSNPRQGGWQKHAFAAGWPNRVGVTVTDLNRDGRPDIVLAPAESAGRLSWFAAPADPKASSWHEHVICPEVDYVHTFKVVDMNHDGAPDIVFGEMHQAARKRVGIFINQGDSESWQFQLLGQGGTHNLRVADLGNDGDLDLIGANWSVWVPPLPGKRRVFDGANPLEIWENLSGRIAVAASPRAGRRIALDRWTHITVDDARAKYGDFAEPKWLKYYGLATADLSGHGNGLRDIVSGRYFYRNPAGDLTGKWERTDFGSNIDACLIADVDGDEFADIIAMEFPSIHWLEATDRRATAWTKRTVAAAPRTKHVNSQGFTTGQIIPGGRLEIVFATDDGVYFYEIPASPEAGNWPRTLITKDASDEGIDLADIDGDGLLDLIAGNNEKYLAWWKNPGNGRGNWTRRIIGTTAPHPVDRVRARDLNGDGRIDIVVTEERSPGREPDANLYWFEQPADPTTDNWVRHRLITTWSLNNLDVADVDRDGDIDIVTGEHKGKEYKLYLFENDGRGSFCSHVIGRGHESHLGTQFADLDGDGDLDLVSIAWDNYKYLHVWRNDAP
ncbi:MAG: VCBS repeat-containing protein [Verrucomicrobia bacterium]|nr:VCBS repeat-containing protein [Verrucomicrobiota bacterium]